MSDYEAIYEAIYGEESKRFDGRPYGWIQWKGTDACVDLHCACGAHGHVDAEFFYHYKCTACGRRYALGCHVPLIELTDEQATRIENCGGCDFITDPKAHP